MARLNAYLKFNDDKCREAMEFYKDCLGGGELTLQTVGETPMKDQMPPETHSKIMHATFKKGELEFFASDMMRDKAVVGDSVILALNCDSEEELKTIFAKLSVGGDVFMAPEKQFWGGVFGDVTDKYGNEWMLNYQEGEWKLS